MEPKVAFYFELETPFQDQVKLLREIVLSTGLEETLKWGQPCYMQGKRNIVLIHHFKEYCALLFFKGALLQNPKGLLIQQTAQVQAARQMRFTDIKTIKAQKADIKAYIYEAIAVEEAGIAVPMKKLTDYPVPALLQAAFKKEPAFKKAFNGLTPGRQRAYLLYFAQPKQEKTVLSRIEKYKPQILAGKGLND
ncbi:Uncharacterized conserved protein YdeI, YjbR/CyaY-like superfamily, DUF1801 family [Arachidicoccus rhizosphaerae]|uniref:Uncharacterized conserved protein YdeI, YjbR/CyaY-like superfamily, DUF1801 family n=1 Tax=Arachidicoccus rhizosphaerae TaxID=551991 RepID=A0A1H3XB64_9BACT|nr:DUF1801 domain-containing protein [Arachidicoccus rhizosphaerae]SDZ96181.1 Uncharacterized conserved protein YdeI, YjbR/CyaY-like superfamily, DUF1801 family [Arachidicoccus rhizosphaerae]